MWVFETNIQSQVCIINQYFGDGKEAVTNVDVHA